MNKSFEKTFFNNNNLFQLHHLKGFNIAHAYSAEPHYDTHLTIAYFKHFCGNIKIEGNRTELNDGDIILLNRNEIHCVFPESDKFCERITLYISENILKIFPSAPTELFDAFRKRPLGKGNFIPAKTVSSTGIDRLLEDIYLLCTTHSPSNEALGICKTVELMSVLNRAIIPENNAVIPSNTDVPTVNKIIKYLSEHFSEDITCDEIAAKFNISKFHMEKIFKSKTGISPWSYVIKRRLLFFDDLIKMGYRAEEACYKCGFKNYSNFYRLYKKHTGMSPLEFKQHLK
ncbi:MAG: AraC family transcriptional regulator [Ruminococcaceae bacterium]|nr:AraC family transcriptional regulator [Oscillospiraceae bacterium]